MTLESLDCNIIILLTIYLAILYLQPQKQQSQPRKRCCYVLESLDYHIIILLVKLSIYSIPAAPEAAISAKEEVLLCLESPLIIISSYCWSIYLFYTCSPRGSNLRQGRGAAMPGESLEGHPCGCSVGGGDVLHLLLVLLLFFLFNYADLTQTRP